MKVTALWAAVVLTAASGIARAADGVVATAAWARATPPGLAVGAGYMTLAGGATPDRLLAARLEGVGRIEFHESSADGGVARMRQLSSVAIPARTRVAFSPAGLHLMLIDLTRPLVAGERRTLVLELQHAGAVRVALEVREATATGPGSASR
jgi:copper(I)-binding protein